MGIGGGRAGIVGIGGGRAGVVGIGGRARLRGVVAFVVGLVGLDDEAGAAAGGAVDPDALAGGPGGAAAGEHRLVG